MKRILITLALLLGCLNMMAQNEQDSTSVDQPSTINEDEVIQFIENFPAMLKELGGAVHFQRYDDFFKETMLEDSNFDRVLFAHNYNKEYFFDQVTRIRYALCALLELEKIEEKQIDCEKKIEKIKVNQKLSEEEKQKQIAELVNIKQNLTPTLTNCSQEDLKIVGKYRNRLKESINPKDSIKPKKTKKKKSDKKE